MRGIVKDKSIRFRLSEPEVIKFKKVANGKWFKS